MAYNVVLSLADIEDFFSRHYEPTTWNVQDIHGDNKGEVSIAYAHVTTDSPYLPNIGFMSVRDFFIYLHLHGLSLGEQKGSCDAVDHQGCEPFYQGGEDAQE